MDQDRVESSGAEDRCSPEGTDREALDSLVDAWWSRYCPACQSRHSMNETTCPDDGEELRDRSVTFNGNEETGLPHTTLGSFGERLAAGEGGSGGPPRGGVAGAAGEEPFRRPPRGSGAAPDAAQGLLPEILGGMWRVGERRGGGTFGSFFIGFHHILGMKVGIKVLRRRLNAASSWRRSFHQEALRVSCLNHPNIVKVFDYGEEEGRPYLVMEYLTGKSLHAYLGDRELDLDDRVEIVRQVAIALSAAHEGAGIGEPLIHLDLKPEHIFVEKIRGKWHVKVIDFGIAEIASAPGTDGVEGQEQRRIAGTLPYMAPERWKYVADPRCDIYSLGIVLYELAAGRKPFQAADPKAMRKLHETIIPTPPSSHRSGTRTAALRGLDDLILRCLEKDPDRRPQTAHGLVEEIENWQARPRRTVAQRVCRAAVAPALTLLLVLATLYWAPWEKVQLKNASGMVVGRNRPLQLDPIVPNLGYEGHDASLEVVGRELPIRLERTPGSQLEARWNDFGSLAPEEGQERTVEVRLRVTGWLGRSVTSAPFELTLDNQIPVVLDTRGQLEVVEEKGRKSLWILGKNPTDFTVTASEPLELGECKLNNITGKASADQRSITFTITPSAASLELVLTDLAGNHSEALKYQVDWIDPPILVSERMVFTEKSEHELQLTVAGDCEKLQAGDDPLSPRERTREGFTIYRKTVSFSVDEECPARREVKVQLWSSVSLKRNSGPDDEKIVTVEYCHRELKIQTFPAGSSRIPEFFTIVDAAGSEIPAKEITYRELELDIDSGGDHLSPFEGRLDLDDDGRLQANPGIESLRGKGWLILTIEGQDCYGNVARWIRTFPEYAAPPKIDTFRLASDGGPGSAGRPLLHPDCPLRSKENVCDLSLLAQVKHPFPVRAELRVGGHTVPVECKDGRCLMEKTNLLGLLKAGPNVLILVARSGESPSLQSERALIIYCAEPLELDHPLSESDQVVNADRVRLEPHSRTGPKITGFTARKNGETVAVTGTEGSQAVEVELSPYGWTTLALQMEFEGGWKLGRSWRYRREPLPETLYTYRLGGAGGVDFERHRDEQAGSSFWFTPGRVSESLIRRFRDSDRGEPFRSEPLAASVRLPEAYAIIAWLTIEARSEKLLGADEEFDLPTIEQLRRMGHRMEPGEEWLERPREFPPEFEAAMARKAAEGRILPKGAKLNERFQFRLILIERGKSEFNPGSAIGAREFLPGGNK